MRQPFLAALLLLPLAAQAQPRRDNLLIFVTDGLRAGMVTQENTPTIWALGQRGVRFANTHSLFPTFTMANASAMATGHYLGDTGIFSNTIYTGRPVAAQNGTVTPFVENDAVLGEVDAAFDGDVLNETTVLRAAHSAGFATAAIGKLGPTLLWDHRARDGAQTLVLDDQSGRQGGIPLPEPLRRRLAALGLPEQAPPRGLNSQAGNATQPGTTSANIAQQDWFVDAAGRAVLPLLTEGGRPFVMVYWSRDPDGTQHSQGDSHLRLVPGINGPTSLAAIRNADANLARLLAALREAGQETRTNVLVLSDHGFSTISKESATSQAARQTYTTTPPGLLPLGFVSLDLAQGLGMRLFDPDRGNAEVAPGTHPNRGNGLLGDDPARPQVVVAANGGSDLIYLPGKDRALAARILRLLAAQDYTGGLFVDDALGRFPGTLPLSAINLAGSGVTPRPSIVLGFRSFATGCDVPANCGVQVADTAYQQGQGMHGSFGRSDTASVMVAAGPGFRRGFVDPAPTSNADAGATAMRLLGLHAPAHGTLAGRVLTEALPNGAAVRSVREIARSAPDEAGRVMVLAWQRVGATRYFDAGGFPGRVLGVPETGATR